MEIKPSQASEMITKFIKAKLVPMLEGSPGTSLSNIGEYTRSNRPV